MLVITLPYIYYYPLFSYIYIYIYIYIYTQLLHQETVCDKRSIFKWSNPGLNSEFPLPKTCCLIKTKGPHLYNYSLIASRGKNRVIQAFTKDIITK